MNILVQPAETLLENFSTNHVYLKLTEENDETASAEFRYRF